jgi:ketosteroid isomerase-like protein
VRARLARTLFAPFLCLAACAAGRHGPSSPPPGARSSSLGFTAADRAEVLAVLERQREAWNRGDLVGYMAGYWRSPELVFTAGGQVRRGFDETLALYQAKYGQAPGAMGQLGFEILDVHAVGNDGAVVLGRWVLTGTTLAAAGVFTVVLERRPEGWRVIHDHTSVDPPPPAAPAPP